MVTWLQVGRSYSNPDSVNYKIAYLREQMEQQLLSLGDLAYEDQVQLAMLGDTIIIGGYLNTELIAADSILTKHLAAGAVTADKLNVDDLSAITANLGTVTAGEIDGAGFTSRRMEPNGEIWIRIDSAKLVAHVDPSVVGAASSYAGELSYTPTYDSGGVGRVGVDWRIYSALGDINLQVYRGNINFDIWGGSSYRVVVNGDLDVSGSLSKGSGTFLIDHPLDPDNKDLVHGFVESPKYELIYRGKVQLVDGVAEVDIDAMCDMSEGTFDALTQNAEVTSLCNLTGFARVKPTKIVDGKFTIVAEEKVSDVISWVVMAERADYFIVNGDRWTDEKGRLIPEHNKPEYKSGDTSRKEGTIGYPRHFKKQQGSKGAD